MNARYELLRLLGRGGMGSVYAAVHHPSGRELAVKIPFEMVGSLAARRALLREAAAAARLRHGNIVRLHDVVRIDDGRLALVMELVNGQNLANWASHWPGWPAVLSVIDGVLDGLGAAHAAGIIHRDLKLENVLVGYDGRAKITDFGVAADLDVRSRNDREHTPGGTPLYMAPEQFSSRGHVGPWTDLYAFGVILHVLCTGEAPFEESTLPRLLIAKHTGVLSGALARATLPPELSALIEALLSNDPRHRPRFAREVRSILARVSGEFFPAGDERAAGLPTRQDTESSQPTLVSPGSPTAVFEPSITPSSRRRRIGTAPTEPSSSSNPLAVLSSDSTPTTFQKETAPLQNLRGGTEPLGEDVVPATIADDPTWLPAPLDPDLGVSVARLRDPEIVGRARELEWIRQAIARVCVSGRSELVGIVGASGVGKSTLARWGLSLVESEALMEPLATSFDAFASGAGGGLRHAIARLLGDPGSTEDNPGWPAAWNWLGSAAEPGFDPERARAWLAGDAALAGPEESAAIAFEILQAAAKIRPIYLWLDDLGWSRDGAIELAEKILALGESPILIVATFRSGTLEHAVVRHATARLLAFPSVSLRELEKLGRDDRAALIRAVAPVRPDLSHALAAALDETTLVMIELVHDWIDSGVLKPTAHGFSTEVAIETLLESRPPHVALANRVESFLHAFGAQAEVAERVLTRAALLGVVFDEALLASACTSFDPEGRVVHEVIDRTLLSGILRPEGRINYRFDHDAIREALVVRLEQRADRVTILDETVEWLLKRVGYARPEVLVRIATLLHASDHESRKAWEVLLEATGVLARNSEFGPAASVTDIAEQWLTEDRVPAIDWRRAMVFYARGRIAFFASRYREAELPLLEAERICEALNDTVLLDRCAMLRIQVLFYNDRLGEAERLIRRSLERASAGPHRNAHSIVVCDHLLAELAGLRNDHSLALEHTRRACQAAREAAEPTLALIQEIELTERLIMLGRLPEAESQLVECLRRIEDVGDVNNAPLALEVQFRLLAGRGQWAQIRADGISLRTAELEKLGDPWRLSGLLVLEALVSAKLDDPALAAASAERFVAAFERSHHDEAFTRYAMRELARVLEARGLGAQAERVRSLSAIRDAAIAHGLAV